jgi:hypothetical protein
MSLGSLLNDPQFFCRASPRSAYFATGNPGSCPSSSPYTEAVIELDAGSLSLIGSYQVCGSDNADLDFGSTPTLFQANGTNMVGVVNKDGTFYAFERDALILGPVWRAKVGNGGACPQCGDGNISPAAWDGQNLYVASGNTSINGWHRAESGRRCETSGSSRRTAPRQTATPFVSPR